MESQQQTLTFTEPKLQPSIKTLTGMVFEIMAQYPEKYWTPWALCSVILSAHGIKISDSSVTARIRDLRKPQYGGHTVLKRKCVGSNAYEYRIDM